MRRLVNVWWCWIHKDTAPAKDRPCWTKQRRDVLREQYPDRIQPPRDCDISVAVVEEGTEE